MNQKGVGSIPNEVTGFFQDWRDSGCLTYHNLQMMKIKTITIPLQGLSEYHQWMPTYFEQIYLLLHIIDSRL
jgi:hypothetical protein